ncbi:uncharacterized protein [Dermacentor albipictus]
MGFIFYVIWQTGRTNLLHIFPIFWGVKNQDLIPGSLPAPSRMGNDDWRLHSEAILRQSVDFLPGPNFLAMALTNPASKNKEKDPDKRNDDLDEKTKRSIQRSALKAAADKVKDEDPKKKKDKLDLDKLILLILLVAALIGALAAEVIVFRRLDQFVKSLPE